MLSHGENHDTRECRATGLARYRSAWATPLSPAGWPRITASRSAVDCQVMGAWP